MEEENTVETTDQDFYEEVMAAAKSEDPTDFDDDEDTFDEADEETEVSDDEDEEEDVEDEEEDSEEEEETEQPKPKKKFKHPKTGEELTLDELFDGHLRQSDYTRKTQELAEQRRQIEQLQMQAVQNQHANLPINQMMDENPQMALHQINQAISQVNQEIDQALDKEDIFAEPKLRRRLDQLKEMSNYCTSKITQASTLFSEISNAIPDLQDKSPKLTNFVNEQLGADAFTAQELAKLTNPIVMGRTAVKVTKLINALYDSINGSKETVKQKIKKPKPNKLKGPGSSEPKSKKISSSKKSNELLKRARKTGSVDDFASYLDTITGD